MNANPSDSYYSPAMASTRSVLGFLPIPGLKQSYLVLQLTPLRNALFEREQIV